MALEKFPPTGKWFLKLTLQKKWITPSERASKSVSENGVGSCVQFCLRSIGPLERCGLTKSVRLFCGTLINYLLGGIGLGLGIFLGVVSLRVLDFFEENSTSKT